MRERERDVILVSDCSDEGGAMAERAANSEDEKSTVEREQ